VVGVVLEGFERPAPGRTEQLGGWVCNKASVRETCLRSCFLLTRLGVCGRQSVREVRRRVRERERERERERSCWGSIFRLCALSRRGV